MLMFWFAIMVVFIFEITGLIVFGWPPKDKDVLEAIELHSKKGVRLNSINSELMYIGDMPYIARHNPCIIGNYYIDGVGIIPYWYKSYKIISRLYSNAGPINEKRRRLKLN